MTQTPKFDKIWGMNQNPVLLASRKTINERFTPQVLCDIAEATNDGHFEAAARMATAAAMGDYDNFSWNDVPVSYVDTTLDEVL